MNEPTPKVSIVIPVFNAQVFIHKALKSVLKTNYPNFEIVVVDDVSTDNTVKIINRYFTGDNRLKFIQNQTKKLAAGTRNAGVKASTGDYIALLDHDIEVHPEWITEMIKIFKKDRFVSVVQGRVLDIKKRHIIQHAGIKINSYLGWVIPVGLGLDSRWACLEPIETFANATGLMFKKSVWRYVGGFDEDLAINTDDWDFNWKCWIMGFRQRLAPKSITYHWSKAQHTRDAWIKRTAWEFHFAKVPYLFIKNYSIENIFKYLPFYLIVNFLRSCFNLIFRLNPSPIIAFFSSIVWIFYKWPGLLQKRKIIQQKRKLPDSYIIPNLMDDKFVLNYFLKHWLPVVGIGRKISTEKPYNE